MRILLYGINYAPELTGVGKYTAELASWLASRGHEVRCITAPPYYPQWRVMDGYSAWRWATRIEDGVKVIRCPLWVPRRPSGMARILHLMSFAISSFPVALAQIFWRPQVVWVVEPTFFCVPAALITARVAKARSWLHIQDFEFDAAIKLGMMRNRPAWRKRLKRVEQFFVRRFDRVSTISNRMMEGVVRLGTPVSRVRFVPNWVDTSRVRPVDASDLRRSLGLDTGDFVALYSGNMGEKQGIEILAAVAKRLEHCKRIRFVLCGDGPMKGCLVRLCQDMPNVFFLPLQPAARLPELLCMADVHLLPQRADAADLVMPSKLAGIMASARPVIATAAEGTELFAVVHQIAQCGIVVPPDEAEQFAAAIERLSVDGPLRSWLGRNGRSYAEAQLDRNAVLGSFEGELLTLECS